MITLEAAFAAGIAVSCCFSGAAFANSVHTKRAAANKARRVAGRTVRDLLGLWMKTSDIRLTRLEQDELVINRALNAHGILRGRMLIPARTKPAEMRPYQPVDQVDADAA